MWREDDARVFGVACGFGEGPGEGAELFAVFGIRAAAMQGHDERILL